MNERSLKASRPPGGWEPLRGLVALKGLPPPLLDQLFIARLRLRRLSRALWLLYCLSSLPPPPQIEDEESAPNKHSRDNPGDPPPPSRPSFITGHVRNRALGWLGRPVGHVRIGGKDEIGLVRSPVHSPLTLTGDEASLDRARTWMSGYVGTRPIQCCLIVPSRQTCMLDYLSALIDTRGHERAELGYRVL